MDDPADVLENDIRNLQWDFDIQTNQMILVRRPDLIIINQKKKKKEKFAKFLTLQRIKLKECEKKDKYFDLARELKILST